MRQSIGLMGLVRTPTTGNFDVPITVSRRLTPSNAAHTYSIRAFVSAGTGVANAGAGGSGNAMPTFMRIVKV